MKKEKKSNPSPTLPVNDGTEKVVYVRTSHNFKLGEFPGDMESHGSPGVTLPDQVDSMVLRVARLERNRELADLNLLYDAATGVEGEDLDSDILPDVNMMTDIDRDWETRKTILST